MAGEIQVAHISTGKTLYALIRNTTGSVWQTTTDTFVAYVTANLGNYDIALTEQGTASRYYVGSFPTLAAAGVYNVVIYEQAGGSPAEGDPLVGMGEVQWDGSVVPGLITRMASGGSAGLLSGQFVNVYSGQLSGHQVSVLSGQMSGQPIRVLSGQLSGQLVGIYSGQLSGQPIFVLSGQLSGQLVTAASGVFGTASLNSGQFVLVYSGQLSGSPIFVLSGQLSGQLVRAASGVFGTASLNSGQSVLVYSGQLSGQEVNLSSGNNVEVWSGTRVNVWNAMNVGTVPLTDADPAAIVIGTAPSPLPSQSGILVGERIAIVQGTGAGQSRVIIAYSGSAYRALVDTNWVVPPDVDSVWALYGARSRLGSLTHSGAIVAGVISGQLSGQLVTTASGAFVTVPSGLSVLGTLYSGQSVNVYSGQLSGQQMTARTVSDKSGYVLASDGLDQPYPESGVNARQMLALAGAAAAGQLSGATTGTITIDGANRSGTNRVTATVDGSGNRTAIVLNLPS